VEYYQRLEQGRAHHPSDQVLDAIADVLRLDEVERDHLHLLAWPTRHRPRQTSPAEPARPELQRMLDYVTVPAIIINDRFDVLALNPIAERLFVPAAAVRLGEWNLARFLFLTREGRHFYAEWDDTAAATTGQLRVAVSQHPKDQDLADLVQELQAGSEAFRRLWSAGDVDVRTHGTKSFRHTALGTLTFAYQNFDLAGDSRQRLVTFTPALGSPTEAALQLLATWANPTSQTEPPPLDPPAAHSEVIHRKRKNAERRA